MDNNAMDNATLTEKKAQLAVVVAEFKDKRVSLEVWLDKLNEKKRLEDDIYDIETPLEQKISDLDEKIMKAEQDVWRDKEELNGYYGRFNPKRDENAGQGGAALGPASAAPPPQVVLEDTIKGKMKALHAMKAKLQDLIDSRPPEVYTPEQEEKIKKCPLHARMFEDPAGLWYAPNNIGYSTYSPGCNACAMGERDRRRGLWMSGWGVPDLTERRVPPRMNAINPDA